MSTSLVPDLAYWSLRCCRAALLLNRLLPLEIQQPTLLYDPGLPAGQGLWFWEGDLGRTMPFDAHFGDDPQANGPPEKSRMLSLHFRV